MKQKYLIWKYKQVKTYTDDHCSTDDRLAFFAWSCSMRLSWIVAPTYLRSLLIPEY